MGTFKKLEKVLEILEKKLRKNMRKLLKQLGQNFVWLPKKFEETKGNNRENVP